MEDITTALTCLCVVCETEVNNRHKNAIECARCHRWTHTDCAGLLAVTLRSNLLLKHENPVYLCDDCLANT